MTVLANSHKSSIIPPDPSLPHNTTNMSTTSLSKDGIDNDGSGSGSGSDGGSSIGPWSFKDRIAVLAGLSEVLVQYFESSD